MLAKYNLDAKTLRGQFLQTGFKQFLYWRDHGSPEADVRDAFGSALVIGFHLQQALERVVSVVIIDDLVVDVAEDD